MQMRYKTLDSLKYFTCLNKLAVVKGLKIKSNPLAINTVAFCVSHTIHFVRTNVTIEWK